MSEDLASSQQDILKPPTRGFTLGSEQFAETNIQRLDRAYGVSARYLALGNQGNIVCLTVFPYEEIMMRHARNMPEHQTSIARKAFLSEPKVLVDLQRIEERSKTHYFPRMLTGVKAEDTNNPWYVIEYVRGKEIKEVTLEEAESFREEFENAIRLAQSVGVHFSDLREEDLRVLADGRIMIIDFNSTAYAGSLSEAEATEKDFERLDKIYQRLR